MTNDNRKKAQAQIHIAKKQLGLDDDTYRQMLLAVTGKDSCRALSLAELYKVIHHLKGKGFKTRRQRRLSPTAHGQMIDVLRALWIKMHREGIVRDGSESALERWVKRASSQRNGGIGVDSMEWLERDTRLVSAVIEDLKRWRARAKKQQAEQAGGTQ